MDYNIKKIIGRVILVSTITIFVLLLILSFNNIKEIFSVIGTARLNYILMGFLLVILYAVIWPLPLCILTKSRNVNISFKNCYLIGSTEHFFNGITPFSTGGQPFQVYAFSSVGVKASESTGILMMNFIIYQIVVNIFCIISLFFYKDLMSGISNLSTLVILGFSMNFLVLLFFIGLATLKSFRTLAVKFIKVLSKIKFLRKLETKLDSFEQYFNDAQIAFKELFKHHRTFFLCIIVKALAFFVFYSIPFFILRAVNIDISFSQLIYTVAMTSFALTMVIWLPTPGASGGIELAFKSLFVGIAGVTSVAAFGGMLLWRLLTYYFLMLVSFILYIVFEKTKKAIE